MGKEKSGSNLPENFVTRHVPGGTITSATGGAKADSGKLPYELLPDDAVEEVVKVLQFGAKKYAPRNWEKGISFSRIYGAIRRHGVAWFRGEDADPETGLHPLAHLACECLFVVAYHLRKTESVDDRPCRTAA